MNDKNWSSITVKEGLFKEMRDELVLNNYPHIQFIHIQGGSFKTITNLTISNLPKLKLLTIEFGSFYNTINLHINSIYLVLITI